jgi:hypothetical protein
MPETDITPILEVALDHFADSLKFISESIADVPEHRLAEQPAGVINHPAWTISHLVAAIEFTLTLLEEQTPLPAGVSYKAFGNGSKPLAHRKEYRSKPDLLAHLALAHDALARAARAKHATHFPRPTPDALRSFAPTIGHVVLYMLTAHDQYHLGQLMVWRRAAGFVQN